MSRPLPSLKTVNSWLKEFPGLVIVEDNQLRCEICNVTISYSTKTDVKKHCMREKHQASCNGELTVHEQQQKFNCDLIEVMAACNIHYTQLNNPVFREFLKKCLSGQYSDVKVPAESTIRKNYLPQHLGTKKSVIRVRSVRSPLGKSDFEKHFVNFLNTYPEEKTEDDTVIIKEEISEEDTVIIKQEIY